MKLSKIKKSIVILLIASLMAVNVCSPVFADEKIQDEVSAPAEANTENSNISESATESSIESAEVVDESEEKIGEETGEETGEKTEEEPVEEIGENTQEEHEEASGENTDEELEEKSGEESEDGLEENLDDTAAEKDQQDAEDELAELASPSDCPKLGFEIDEEEIAEAAIERATPSIKLGYVPGEIIIEWNNSCSEDDLNEILEMMDGQLNDVIMESDESDFMLITISDMMTVDKAAERYSAFPEILKAGRNAVSAMCSYETEKTNDKYLSYMYHMESDNGSTVRGATIYKAWDRLTSYEQSGKTLNSVKVTVIDTGCSLDHEDMIGVIDVDSSKEIYSDGSVNALKGDNYDDGVYIQGQTSHGTHVTGIIGAKVNNGKGVAGAASILGSKLEISVIDAYCGTGLPESNIIKAISLAVDNNTQVINMSFGETLGTGKDSNAYALLKSAAESAYNKGIVIICAAGNNGTDDYSIPGDFDSTISVINTKRDGERNSASNYGVKKDICAPGTDIAGPYGDSTNSNYYSMTGTSMAAPIVTSVVALMLSVDPTLDPEEVRSILRNTATDLGEEGFDKFYAAGLVNADAAVKYIIDSLGGIPDETQDDKQESENTEQTETVNNGSTGGSGNSRSSGSSGGSGGGGGGGGGGTVKSEPTVVTGSKAVNPVTKKIRFIGAQGQIYRNSWLNTEITDGNGNKKTVKIYTDADGDIATGWQWIRCADGIIRCSYFSSESGDYGACYIGRTTPDKYTVDGNGYWVVNGKVQTSDRETVSRIPAAEAAEAAAAAQERTKTAAELGYVPGQILVKASGSRAQIEQNIAQMGGNIIGYTDNGDGTAIVTVKIADHITVATAESLYKANPLFKSASKNGVLKL